YAVADDGLIFSCLATVNKFTRVRKPRNKIIPQRNDVHRRWMKIAQSSEKLLQVPLNAIIVFTLLNATLALVFDLEALVEFLSIGTLLAYSVVSASVLILRYQPAPINGAEDKLDEGTIQQGRKKIMKASFRWQNKRLVAHAQIPGKNFSWKIYTAGCDCTSFWIFLARIHVAISLILIIGSLIFIAGHEQNSQDLSFRVPLVPLIPALGLLINCFMMAYLAYLTWARFFIWMAIGELPSFFDSNFD
ncbi:unnamed protein product, partial [Cylicostephanus goldi]